MVLSIMFILLLCLTLLSVGLAFQNSPLCPKRVFETVVSAVKNSDKSLAYELLCGDVAWNTLMGEADRSLRLGIGLEKSGQARAATAALHEAATLYQCFLDSGSDFAHVTAMDDGESRIVLAYLCLRLAHLNSDALGDAKAAVRLFKEAIKIDRVPNGLTYLGLAKSLEASGGHAFEEILEALTKARSLDSSNKRIIFETAVILDRMGEKENAEPLFEQIRRSESEHSCFLDSWGYVRWHTRKIKPEELSVQRGTYDMIKIALDAAMPLIKQGGLVCEFGVGSGRSIRMTQELLPLETPVHGFDTFTGLPQAWGNEPKGAYSTGGAIPKLEGSVFFYTGLFGDTLPAFLEDCGKEKVLAYANIDCDLYTSTLDILESMVGRIIPGTILIFDEYICHPSWRQDEFRAWRECCKRFGWKYEYLAFSLSSKQAVVRVLDA